MNQKLITITIPTYNRLNYLQTCLEQLLPQVGAFSTEVEVYITDNHSTDGTKEFVESLARKHEFISYSRNEKNIGYTGNQVKCFLHPSSQYTAILCDDDVYLPGALSSLIHQIKDKAYSLVAINYVGFTQTFDRPENKTYAPDEDKFFPRGYDIMNHPSVGHYSGLIFDAQGAKKIVQSLLQTHDSAYHENMRGIIFDVANRLTATSPLPSYFIGKRILGCYKQDVLDYDSLKHLCIDYYNYFQELHQEGLISSEDLRYRKDLVRSRLLRSTFSSLCPCTSAEIKKLWKMLKESNLLDNRNRVPSKVLFQMALFPPSKLMMNGIYKTYRLLK